MRDDSAPLMSGLLDSMAGWFAGLGIHPMLGALILGLLVGILVRGTRRRGDSPDAPAISLSAGVEIAGPRSLHTLAHGTTTLESSGGSITVNGQTFPVPPDKLAELARLVREKSTVQAIRLLREVTGLQLVDAKLIVDAMTRTRSVA